MNKVILMGRLTRDPEVRYSQGDNATAIARFTLAVDRRIKRDNEASVDYINCVSFGRSAEFAEKYFHKGTKIVIAGRIQTGSYTNKDGQKVMRQQESLEKSMSGVPGFLLQKAVLLLQNITVIMTPRAVLQIQLLQIAISLI